MQDFNEQNELMRTELLKELKDQPELGEGNHRIIGYLPKKGKQITVNGLLFDVTESDFIRGRFVAKISKP